MLILACDTSNSTCCAGLYEDGKELVFELNNSGRTHSETFMPIVDKIVKESGKSYKDIDAVAVTVGPGSFTGIRIGLSAVKGMCLAMGKPCIPVSSTKALALSVENITAKEEDSVFIPCFDARNNRVFASVRGGDGYSELIEEGAYDADDLVRKAKPYLEGKTVFLLGNGADTMQKALEGTAADIQNAKGCVIIPRGVYKASEGIEPVNAAGVGAVYCAVSSAERLKKQ